MPKLPVKYVIHVIRFYGNFARNFGICLFFSLCEAAVKLDEDLIATEIERSNTTSAPELRLQT